MLLFYIKVIQTTKLWIIIAVVTLFTLIRVRRPSLNYILSIVGGNYFSSRSITYNKMFEGFHQSCKYVEICFEILIVPMLVILSYTQTQSYILGVLFFVSLITDISTHLLAVEKHVLKQKHILFVAWHSYNRYLSETTTKINYKWYMLLCFHFWWHNVAANLNPKQGW